MNRDIITNGELMETLVQTGGWRLLEKYIDKVIDEHEKKLISLSATARKDEDIVDVRAEGVYILAYRFIKNFPKELIDKKNRELEKPKVDEEQTKW